MIILKLIESLSLPETLQLHIPEPQMAILSISLPQIEALRRRRRRHDHLDAHQPKLYFPHTLQKGRTRPSQGCYYHMQQVRTRHKRLVRHHKLLLQGQLRERSHR
jgi:hypothetical protein